MNTLFIHGKQGIHQAERKTIHPPSILYNSTIKTCYGFDEEL
jgi:hypothetical protein